jgi:hypothetical protein
VINVRYATFTVSRAVINVRYAAIIVGRAAFAAGRK